MRRVPLLILALLLSVFTVAYAEEKKEEDYVYPIAPESENWSAYTPKQKAEMLKIDEQTLKQMSDRQLVRAVAEYPYLVDIHLYGYGLWDSVPIVEGYCSALSELITREDFARKLEIYLAELQKEYQDSACTVPRKEAKSLLMEDLLYYYQHRDEWTEPELIMPEQKRQAVARQLDTWLLPGHMRRTIMISPFQ